MNIKERENNLFKKWNNSGEIVKDGIITIDDNDKLTFLNFPTKILVIMKEANGNLSSWDNDLRKFLQEGGRAQTWNNIARWTYGLQNIDKNIDELWNKIENISNDDRVKQLKSIASINLKKMPGTSKTNKRELKKVFKEDIELLKEQVSLYKPDIILCGGYIVGNLIQEYELFGKFEFDYPSNKVRLAKLDNKLLISYYHPQAIANKKELFINLINAVKNI